MNTKQDYAWRQIPVKDTPQLKVGDRVRVISGANIKGYDNEDGTVTGFYSDAYKTLPDIMGVFFDKSPTIEVYCYSMPDNPLKYEILPNPQSIIIQPKPAPPTPKWLPIDKDNLPDEPVLAGNIDKEQIVVNRITINHLDGTIQSHNRREYFEVTHYIPLSDLLNLPIAE
jgi:hypothetical protein